jgi:hypothetical protein
MALLGLIQEHGWKRVLIADDSAALVGWKALYRGLGIEFNLAYSPKLLDNVGVSYQEHIRQMGSALALMQQDEPGMAEEFGRPRQGLKTFLKTMKPEEGFVIVADNFGHFVRRIVARCQLELDTAVVAANELHDDGQVTPNYGGIDVSDKAALCQILLDHDIEVGGIFGTLKTINFGLLRYATERQIPLIWFDEPGFVRNARAGANSIGMPVMNSWQQVLPLLVEGKKRRRRKRGRARNHHNMS